MKMIDQILVIDCLSDEVLTLLPVVQLLFTPCSEMFGDVRLKLVCF